ncbi:Acetate kinase [Spirochaeta thermophila DSM 6578]|uniref:Acetate kinase n=1 Tax=Winmispira thermophila (strain ATCC 700085 / DSM 6578 / Z-1203) TaxID=869211 RepID=G0GD54_WINT7|nr:acetate kinase [Spirochaeta thermophila]AEJ62129.1 Acetate kinase [Spirochaeta thermophila DSM 6578]
MVIMTLNCGSSSVKYQIYDWDKKRRLASGIVERVTQKGSVIVHEAAGKPEYKKEQDCPTHREAIQLIIEAVLHPEYGAISDLSEIKAVGHRVVHGGEKFAQSVVITDEVVEVFKSIAHLAPLHNPANIQGIEAARQLLPDVPHCAIMDTAWHQTMPDHSYIYALPYEWYEKYGVRRYGFHGTSFLYTSRRAAVLLGKKPSETNLIIAHIGNGASINAVKNGCSYDTSMGLTPLEGLVMGTRCGDIDPAIPFYIMQQTGLSPKEVESILNKKSGVLGITGKWVDRRDVEIAAEQGDKRAILCQTIEGYRIKKYIGAYMAALGRVDAIVFTAGVGEKGPIIRQIALEGLEALGVKLDPERNRVSMTRNAETIISTDDSPVKVFVIPTDEEMVMTEDTYALMNGTYDIHTRFTYTFENPSYRNAERLEKLPRDMEKWPGLEKIILNT